MVYKRNPRKGLNITCYGFKAIHHVSFYHCIHGFDAKRWRCHYCIHSSCQVQTSYGHGFHSQIHHNFRKKNRLRRVANMMPASQNQPKPGWFCVRWIRCWHPLCIYLGTVSTYIIVISTNLLGVLSNHVHMMSISFHEKSTLTSQSLSQTKLWWIYPELTKSCCFPNQHMESQPSHSWNSWSS